MPLFDLPPPTYLPEEPPGAEAPAEAPPPDPFPREADFVKGHVEVRVQLGFDGYRPGPFSLFASFVGWNEFGLSVEYGAIQPCADCTFGLGLELYYARPFLLEVISRPISNTDDHDFIWQMHDRGGSLKPTFHYTGLASIDPYAFALVGPTAFTFKARVKGTEREDLGSYTTAGLRIGLGVGLSAPVWKRLVVGGELRYLASFQFDRRNSLTLLDEDGDEVTFLLNAIHRPPSGFSWVLHAGWRF